MTAVYAGLIKEPRSDLRMLIFYDDRYARLDQQGAPFQLWAVLVNYGEEPAIYVVVADDATQAAETIEALSHSPFYDGQFTALSSDWFGQIHVEDVDLNGHSLQEFVVDKSQDEEALPVGSLVGPMGIYFHFVSEKARHVWARRVQQETA